MADSFSIFGPAEVGHGHTPGGSHRTTAGTGGTRSSPMPPYHRRLEGTPPCPDVLRNVHRDETCHWQIAYPWAGGCGHRECGQPDSEPRHRDRDRAVTDTVTQTDCSELSGFFPSRLAQWRTTRTAATVTVTAGQLEAGPAQ